jgi:ferric-dicitrate binding protein FerR (iron transport regulator)
LEEGSVKIENALQTGGTKAPLFLKPKQKAIYSSNTVEVNNFQTASIKNWTTDQIQSESIQSKAIKVDSAIDTKPFTSWKDNRWIFRHETLHDLARKLERRYDVVITFSDSMIRNYTFSGSLYEESIEQVFEAIKIIAPINFKIKHKEIEISTNEYLKSRYNKYDKLQ